MIKYFIQAISKGIGFSKTESKGTLLLILIIIGYQTAYQINVRNREASQDVRPDNKSELLSWVEEISNSYSVKEHPEINDPQQPTRLVIESKATGSPSKREIPDPGKVAADTWTPVDINTATAEEFQSIKGIGKVYSERIIKYRDRLGGFHDITQLGDVYGLNDELVAKIGDRFHVLSNVKAIDLNIDSVKHLIKHPYISYDLAWVLINYRKQHGDIQGFEQLATIKALSDSTLQKLKPYVR